MASGKRGRKRRKLGSPEKLLIGEFCTQLHAQLARPGESIESLAAKLHICRASLYKYLAELTLPGYEVLKRAHDVLGFRFQYMDFAAPRPRRRRRMKTLENQAVLPFLDALRQEDLEVIGKKTVESENALEVTIRIRFSA